MRVLITAALVAAAACGRNTAARTDADTSAVTAASPSPLVAGIDHFYATAPNAETLFRFFRDSLGLPQSWPFRRWGDFASGGVSLGNVAFELVTWQVPKGEVLPTEFGMVAFEPVGETNDAVAELDRRGIAHDAPTPNVSRDSSGREVGWINTGLTGLVPNNVAFVCDYKQRPMVAASRQAANDELARREGGPLGIRGVKEIVIGTPDLEAARREWRKLIDTPDQEVDGVFAFRIGPRVRLVRSNVPGIQRMVLEVRSLQRATEFLDSHSLLKRDTSAVVIAPASIGGLQVTLVER